MNKTVKILLSFFFMIVIVSFCACNKGEAQNASATTSLPDNAVPSDTSNAEDPNNNGEPSATESSVSEPEPEEPYNELVPIDKNKTYEILFIGNSCTSVNNLPLLLSNIADKDGYDVNFTSVLKGGWYLDGHADSKDESGAKVDAQLKAKKWDYVVFQEQIKCFIDDPARFYDGARALVKKIRDNGAVPILYSTWAYAEGNSYFEQRKISYDDMAWRAAACCEAISRELEIEVAYAGLAIRDLYVNHGDIIDPYKSDLVHSNEVGTYIAALTVYSVIFNIDPTETAYSKPFYTTKYPDIVKNAVRDVTAKEVVIPYEYKTESKNVTKK